MIAIRNGDHGEKVTIAEVRGELRMIRLLLERVCGKLDRIDPPGSSTATQFRIGRKIINDVAKFYDHTPQQVTFRIRNASICWARHVAMTLVNEFSGMNHCQIGKLFDRGHTTVLNAIEHVTNRCETEEQARVGVEHLRHKFKAEIEPING